MAESETVLYELEAGVATIILNRPARRNAITQEMLTALHTALGQAADDPAVRAILITGAGQSFCAGQDLSAFGSESGPDAVRETVLGFYKPVILRLCTVAKPVIGAINGAAAGAGAALALACDLRLLGDDAYLLFAFSNIGLVPDAGASWFLARQVGYSRAYELAIEGERIPAGRCLELGLANRVVPAAKLLAAAHEWAQRLAARPTVALGLTKRALHEATVRELESLIHLEADLQTEAVTTADHREGVAAFLARRKPDFQGR